MAGDAMELANPVIGTIEPAPANFPILLYTLMAVKKIPRNIKVMLVAEEASSWESP